MSSKLADRPPGGLGHAVGPEARLAQRQIDGGGRRVAPGLRRLAGDREDIGAGLARQTALPRDETLRPRLAAVVGDRGEADVAVGVREVGQIGRRRRKRARGIERIVQSAPPRRLRHELGDALRTLRAHRGGVEKALPPDEAGEEIRIEAVVAGEGLDHAANVVDVGRAADAARAVGGAGAVGPRSLRSGERREFDAVRGGGRAVPGRRRRDGLRHGGRRPGARREGEAGGKRKRADPSPDHGRNPSGSAPVPPRANRANLTHA